MEEEELEVKNAVITNASLEIEDHGILTAYLTLDYGGTGQVFGGYSLYLPKDYRYHDVLSYAGHFIYRCLEIAGVEKWSDLKGKSIRVKASYSHIEAIGHIIKDDWFNPKNDFKGKEE